MTRSNPEFEANIAALLRDKEKNPTLEYVYLLCFHETLLAWAIAQNEPFLEGLRETGQLEAFWQLLEARGICLSAEEKQTILREFLSD